MTDPTGPNVPTSTEPVSDDPAARVAAAEQAALIQRDVALESAPHPKPVREVEVAVPPSQDPNTTGHEWDGIHELSNPLPKWWVGVFYATIIWGVWYTLAYPAWPMLQRATQGYLGWDMRADVQAEIDAVDLANAALTEKLAAAAPADIPADAELAGYATSMGAAVFRSHCSQCHGAGAAGVQAAGYPNLLDDDWLWGGTMDDIVTTVTHGIRNDLDPDARYSQMPAFEGILPEEEIAALVQHVRAISGQEHDATLAAAGAPVFEANCAACHGADGTGDRTQGAPNLTDAIWLYGGEEADIDHTIRYARFGVMPPWSQEVRPAQGLSQAEIHAVATYVHGLGGGE